jgi:hypothetical protein
MRDSLKFHENKGYCTLRPVYIYHYILLDSTKNENCFGQKTAEKIKTHFMFRKKRTVCETTSSPPFGTTTL